MRRRIIRSTEQRRYSLLVEYHELPPVFLRSLGYILELFSSPFQACSPPRQSSGLRVPVPCSACYRRYMLRKTVSTLCRHDFTHDVDHVRKSSLRFSFGRGQRSYAYVLRGRREPGNEAMPTFEFSLRLAFSRAWVVCTLLMGLALAHCIRALRGCVRGVASTFGARYSIAPHSQFASDAYVIDVHPTHIPLTHRFQGNKYVVDVNDPCLYYV